MDTEAIERYVCDAVDDFVENGPARRQSFEAFLLNNAGGSVILCLGWRAGQQLLNLNQPIFGLLDIFDQGTDLGDGMLYLLEEFGQVRVQSLLGLSLGQMIGNGLELLVTS